MGKPQTAFYHPVKKTWTIIVKEDVHNLNKLKPELQLHKRLLNIFWWGSHYYFVLNIYEGVIEFMSYGLADVLGDEADEVDIEILMDKIHPSDKCYLLNFEHSIILFFKPLSIAKIKKYNIQYCFRAKTKSNKYIRIPYQAIQVDYDENNLYCILCLQTDISHIKQEGKLCFSIIGLDGELSYYNIQHTDLFNKSYDPFTNRKREILKYIMADKSEKNIADKLFIGIHTIYAHRKNILNKANVKTPIDLMRKAV